MRAIETVIIIGGIGLLVLAAAYAVGLLLFK
jgi:hypothetical protein